MLALALALALLAGASVPQTFSFEISSNKPFVRVTLNDSAPQWFILDTGNNGGTLIARECADRLRLRRSAESKAEIGAGSGADVGLSVVEKPVRLRSLGKSLTLVEPTVVSLAHVSRAEGRRLDGSLGADFISQHVLVIDYARGTIAVHDPDKFVPPRGGVVVPVSLDTGWPIAQSTITTRGGKTLPCRLIVDTGVRFTLALFRPFSEKNGLYDSEGVLHDVVIGAGVGGFSRGDVARLDAISLGPRTFTNPVAVFSRDTSGIFSLDGPDGILGGELLRRHRVTFDYPHQRIILEPYEDSAKAPFEFDMSGLFLGTDDPDFRKIRILNVNPGMPAVGSGLQIGDEIVAIDGQRTPALTLDQARAMLRVPVARKLEVRRGEQKLVVNLTARRMV
jgi:hypothetical protein